MNYEEKYKAALERARALNDGKDVDVEAGTTTCEYIFPELKEDNDERIRKGLIKAVSRIFEGNKLFDTDVTREEALAWLDARLPYEKEEIKGNQGEISPNRIIGTEEHIKIALDVMERGGEQ